MGKQYNQLVSDVRSVFKSGCTQALDFRRKQLAAMIKMMEEHRDDFADALYKDMRKPKSEAMVMEIDFTRNECVELMNNFGTWAQPDYAKKNMITLVSTAYIKKEPLGVVLVMGAFNYPVQLSVCPMAGAIAAGNCVILKPSELSPHVAGLLSELIPKYLDPSCYQVVCGGVEETTELLQERFDHIFYTGGNVVAKIVMAAASKHLTPVTLELGGKSPLYLDKDTNLKVAAQRIVWGKYANCGQTCVAPDYLMCEKEMVGQLVDQLKQTMATFYHGNMKESQDYGRIINHRHFKRLTEMMKDSGQVVIGGDSDESQLYISPTVMRDVNRDAPVMQEEIFGPILPIITVSGIDDAIDFINSREKPLAMYVFSNNQQVAEQFLSRTSSGSFVSNDVMVQLSLSSLPFGGVGSSGMGSYHGKFSFDTFSHHRAVLLADRGITEPINNIRYPPYSEKKLSWASWLLKK